MSQISYIRDNSEMGFSVKSIPIEYEYWGDKFPHVEKVLYERMGLAAYVCPKNTNFFVRANLNSDDYEIVQISAGKWTGTNCKSDDEINDVITAHKIDLALISTYFDFDDYQNPIHYYLQDANVFPLISTLCVETQFTIKQNQATLNDGIYLGAQGSSNVLNFYTPKVL